MTIYIIQILLIMLWGLLFLSNMNKKISSKKMFFLMTFITLVTVAAFRSYTVGYDTTQYIIAYRKARLISVSQFSSLRYEYGFTLLLFLLNKITSNHQILLIISTLFINYAILKFIYKNSENVFVSVLMYVFMNFYFFYMSSMRQAIAISILLLGFDNVQKEKWNKFIMYVLLACTFHMSSLLAFLFIPLKKINYNRKFIYSIFIIFILSFFLGHDIFHVFTMFSNRLFKYSMGKFNVENYFGALLKFLVSFLIFSIGLLIALRNEQDVLYNKKNKLNVYIGILTIAQLFLILTMKVGIFSRFSMIFNIFILIWFPNMISKIRSPKSRLFIYIIVLSLLFLYWLTICILRPEWFGVIPYNFFWEVV